jgi:ketoreductase RED1
MPLVEVVRGGRTSEDAVAAALDCYTFLDRTPVVECKEMPGFIGNRPQVALVREATSSAQQGAAAG